MEFCYLSGILFVWVLLPDYGYFCGGMVFLPYLCRNMSNFAVQNFFALFTFDDILCAHFREKNMTNTFNTSVVCGCSRHVPWGNGGCGFLVAKGWLGGFRCFSFDVKRFTLWAAQAKTKCFQEGIVCNRTAVTRIAWVPSQERQISCACTPKRAKSHISLQNLLFLVFAVDIPKARLDSAHLFECLS